MVFTKYDQFLRNVGIDLDDCNYEDPSIDVSKQAKEKAAKEIFIEHYLGPLAEGTPWVRMGGGLRVRYMVSMLMFFGSYEPTRGKL